MAVDLLSDTSSSRGISPRISFSHDLKNCEIVPIEPHTPLKTSLLDYDFDFCVSKRRCDQDSTLADELFANGVILPIQIKRKNIPFVTKSKSSSSSSSSSSSFLPPLPPLKNNNEGDHTKETDEKQSKTNNNNNNNEDSKSFWKFKRSKSLNCGRIYRRGLCSLPLLSRSKSTGSTTSAKRSLISSKDEASVNHHYNNQHNGKQASMKNSSLNNNHQKPPLKKNYGGASSFNSGLIQVSPIINMPTASLFGIASFFTNGGNKDKARKK